MMFVIRRDSGDSDGHISGKFSNVGERGTCMMYWCTATLTYSATVQF